MRKANTDYKAKAEFLAKFEAWRIENDLKHDDITRKTHNSRGTYANWLNPYEEGKPSIKIENIAILSRWSGIKFKSEYPEENERCEVAIKELGDKYDN